jgi:hypothetical protein
MIDRLKGLEHRLRRAADARGWMVRKKKRDGRVGLQVRMYMLIDRETGQIVAGQGYNMTAEEVLGVCAGTRSAIA